MSPLRPVRVVLRLVRRAPFVFALSAGFVLVAAPTASAQRFFRAPRTRPAPALSRAGLERSPMLGSFVSTPYMIVGGDSTGAANGYTPLQGYGDRAMALYGPFSSLRAISAPVRVNVRGYDGVVRPGRGVATSYPFLPPAGAVVYPVRASQRGAFPYQQTPPWWDAGHNWVDFD